MTELALGVTIEGLYTSVDHEHLGTVKWYVKAKFVREIVLIIHYNLYIYIFLLHYTIKLGIYCFIGSNCLKFSIMSNLSPSFKSKAMFSHVSGWHPVKTDPVGQISTEDYPKYYEDNAFQITQIIGPEQHRIRLQFDHVNVSRNLDICNLRYARQVFLFLCPSFVHFMYPCRSEDFVSPIGFYRELLIQYLKGIHGD